MTVKPIPDGFHSVTPYLVVPGLARVIDFLKQAFGAVETQPRMELPDGRIMHAEVRIVDSHIMMGEPVGEFQPMPSMFYLYVTDTDAVYQRALAAGGVSEMAPADQFYGNRNAGVKDSAGNRWWMGTHIEDVTPEEIARRAASRAGAQG